MEKHSSLENLDVICFKNLDAVASIKTKRYLDSANS